MRNADREIRIDLDQVYSHTGGKPRLADLYLPTSRITPSPVVIWIHGGGWRFGDRRLAPDLSLFAKRSGIAVVSIDYRLSDEAKFPAPVEDVKTAVRWTRSIAPSLELDDSHIGLWGSSAGAHLAACAALSGEDEFLSAEHSNFSSGVQAVVDGYGPTNFARIDQDRASFQAVERDAESLVVSDLLPAGDPDSFESRLLGTIVSAASPQVELANPIHYLRPGNAPFLILHGEADSLMPWQQSWLLFEALSDAEDDATLVLFEKLGHGFFNNPRLADFDYGKVKVHRSQTERASRAHWSCNVSSDIPSMVMSFFRAHLICSNELL